jgi:hypothetical protein
MVEPEDPSKPCETEELRLTVRPVRDDIEIGYLCNQFGVSPLASSIAMVEEATCGACGKQVNM